MKNKLILLLLLTGFFASGQTSINYNQSNLAKRVTLNLRSQKVSDVLKQVAKAGNFYFTYNGALFGQDSLVNVNVRNKPIRDLLDELFNGTVDYKENEEYIILRYAVNHCTIDAESIVTAENLYSITGRVVDTKTGKYLKNASVYEKRLLQSALTDEEGFFSLKFKGNHTAIILTASKETYRDTSIIFLSSIDVKPQAYDDPDKEKGTFVANLLDNIKISRWLTSSKQRIQNINIPNFLASMPVQASFTPGLSSRGSMSGNVVNKFSLNLIGGYTAGVNGAEIAGVFNLNKANVRYLQMAGVLNAIGGNTEGAQVAGVVNMVAQNANGLQVSGLYNQVVGKANGIQISTINYVNGLTEGMQISGVGNFVNNEIHGIQIAGAANIAKSTVHGFQLSGVSNITFADLKGVQLSGVVNYAKHNKGFQLGLVNLADTSSGFSLGLINLIRNGYHKISISTNDLINANIAFKGGNAKLYTILLLGKNLVKDKNIETVGLGFGHDFFPGKTISFSTELTSQYLHLGRWDYANLLNKFQLNVQLKLAGSFSIYGGPSLNYYITDAPFGHVSAKGYSSNIVPSNAKVIGKYNGWLGFILGVNIF
ncbi:peptidase associated/transthyretin-like domain-containing protein [Pedobacter sp.]